MTRPLIGARLVCTSKTDKKIPTRRVFAFSTSFSSSSKISITAPSAGATITFGSDGTARSGSRKNATVHKNTRKKNHSTHAENNPETIASSARKVRIQRASQRAWRRIRGAYFVSLKRLGKPAKSVAAEPRVEPQYSGLGDRAPPISSGNYRFETT